MIIFITYANSLFAKSAEYCVKMAVKKGKVDKIIHYHPNDIDSAFYEKHKDILTMQRGNGLWLWKPYFLCKALESANDGDIVLYCDAGSFFFRSCRTMLQSMEDDIWVSDLPLIEKQFTKPELLKEMQCEAAVYTETNQILANFVAIRKTERGVKFAREWLSICAENGGGNLTMETSCKHAYYIAHRSDQSVLSLLIKKWGIKPHLDPSQYGRVPEKYYAPDRLYQKPMHKKEYKPCIILHRGKKPEWKKCLNGWICTWIPLPLLYFLSYPYRQAKKCKI